MSSDGYFNGDLVYLIPNIRQTYGVTIKGVVVSKRKGNWYPLKTSRGSSGEGYLQVSVVDISGKRKNVCIHVLMCSAFHGSKPFDGATVSHKDGNKDNNIPENLEWSTYSDNLLMKRFHGTHDCGSSNSRSSLTKEELFVVRWLLDNTKMSQYEIAAIVKVNRLTITKIANGYRYNAITVSVVEDVSVKFNKFDRY